jgi:DNA-binding CsgD family transcriptional regulator/tetratricopeptide (TPR) repeat protein
VLPQGAVVRCAGGYRLDLATEVLDTETARTGTAHSERLAPAIHPATALVGRTALLDRCLQLVRRGQGVVLHGDPGSGRSRLLEEIVLHAAQEGSPATLLRCRAVGADVPLGVYSPLLQGDLPAGGLPLVIAARTSIIDQLAGAVLVLGIDDLHQIDRLSAVLTMQLVQGGHAVLVGSHRNMRVVPVPVADLWHDGYCEHVHVGHLDLGGLAHLVLAHTGRELDGEQLDRLFQLTDGNPLFATTVLQHPELRLTTGDPTLEAVIAGQLAGLSPELRDALAVVAIAEPIGVGVLEHVVDQSALVALERASLITIDRHAIGSEVRVRHPLYGEHIRSCTSRLLARGIRAQLADVLAARGVDRREDLLRLAAWSIGGGRPLERVTGVAAAREAFRHEDLDLARQAARAVWEAHRDADAAIVLGEVALAAEPGEAVMDIVHAALPHADDRQRRRLSVMGARAAMYKLGDGAAVDRLLADDADDPVLASLHAQMLAYQGRAGEALERLAPVPLTDGSLVYRAVAEATALSQLGRPEPALDRVEAALAAIPAASLVRRTIAQQVVGARARPLLLLGRIDEAERGLREAMAAAREANAPQVEALNALTLGALLPFAGRPDQAWTLAERAASLLSGSGHHALARWAWTSAAFAGAVAGDLHRAQQALDRLGPAGAASMADGMLPLVHGAIARLRFDRPRAAAALRSGAAMCRERGFVLEEACALHDLARVGEPLDDRLVELGDRVGGLIEGLARHAVAIACDDHDGLLAASDRFAELGAWGFAAEAAARAAEAAAAAGSPVHARRAAERYRHLAGRCDPGLVAPPIVLAEPLTPREREIAEMAARGWTNAAIAEHLDISVRTVDNHLSRSFEKLAVDGRSDLGTVFGLDV